MEDKFDKKIAKMLNEDVYIPQKIANRIKSSLKEERKEVMIGMKINKLVATMMGVIIVGTGATFAAKAIIDYRNNSINEAKANDYFEKVDMDYITDAGLGIKIDDYFIDNGRVGITLNIKSDEQIEPKEIYSTELTSDNTWSEEENGSIRVHPDESAEGAEYNNRFNLITFLDENGNEVKYSEDSIGGFGPELAKAEKLENNIVKQLYTMPIYKQVAPGTMKVTIKRIVAYVNPQEIKEYVGNWEFEIKIADRFVSKVDDIEYTGSVNVPNVFVEKATLSATELTVTLKTDDLEKLLYSGEDKSNILYSEPKLTSENMEYNSEDINVQQSNYYSENKMVLKFDISKYSAEDSYKITLNGGMKIELTK
ncbi:MAG: hypothetical protein LBL91_00760 [Lachnospiraceae bacterium]|jgi:hypothetical protein|nr:hypothetical protein [Lachnospiraceae bacterium]